jgi:3-oxoacyl-[acyl-carrier protein] reductase
MKKAIILGASGDIGSRVVKKLYEDGFIIVAAYNKNKAAADKISKAVGGCPLFQCDITSEKSVQNLFDNAIREVGKIDLAVNCTGNAYSGLLQEMSSVDIENIINTNLLGSVYFTKCAAKHMVKNHKGCIINISSVWGVAGASCESVYSAAKGGVITFTKAVAKELAPSGVRVNCISPGVIKTKMLDCYTEEDLENLKKETPLGRIGTAEDVANVVCFLRGESADFITGQNIVADGGFIL